MRYAARRSAVLFLVCGCLPLVPVDGSQGDARTGPGGESETGASVPREGVKAIAPRVVVVEKEGAAMKCSGGAPFYAVRTLATGQLLRVDGADGTWLRVEYLDGMPAYVKAEDAAAEADGKTVKLNKASRLLAVNEQNPERGHWWSLLEQELPTGTVLEVRETVKGMNEVVVGYKVTAPGSARGYVKADDVRDARPDEAVRFAARTDIPVAATAHVEMAAAPANGAEHGADSAVKPEAAAASANEAPATIYDIDTLMVRYAKVMTLSGKEAEEQLPIVIADFKRKAETLSDSVEDRRVRLAVNQRMQALRLRQDILAAIKKFADVDLVSVDAGDR